jgi:microcystin-dependent protein
MAIVLDTEALGGAGGRLVPVGTCLFTYGAGAPSGYLVRDGSLVPVALYPALFAVLGYTYGGAGALFGLPDDRGLVLAGSGLGTALPGLTNHVLGAVFGEESHVQLVGELAQHTHLQNAHTHLQDAHNHLQDAHNHLQNAHNHTQDAHTHTQDSHLHSISITSGNDNTDHVHAQFDNVGGTGGSNLAAAAAAFSAGRSALTGGRSANHQHLVSGNSASATATNQNTVAVNQATTATNQATTATNQATTATNQNTTAVNLDEGSSDPMNVIQPTRYATPIIAY